MMTSTTLDMLHIDLVAAKGKEKALAQQAAEIASARRAANDRIDELGRNILAELGDEVTPEQIRPFYGYSFASAQVNHMVTKLAGTSHLSRGSWQADHEREQVTGLTFDVLLSQRSDCADMAARLMRVVDAWRFERDVVLVIVRMDYCPGYDLEPGAQNCPAPRAVEFELRITDAKHAELVEIPLSDPSLWASLASGTVADLLAVAVTNGYERN